LGLNHEGSEIPRVCTCLCEQPGKRDIITMLCCTPHAEDYKAARFLPVHKGSTTFLSYRYPVNPHCQIFNKITLPQRPELIHLCCQCNISRQIMEDVMTRPAKVYFLFQFRVNSPHITKVCDIIEIPFVILTDETHFNRMKSPGFCTVVRVTKINDHCPDRCLLRLFCQKRSDVLLK